MHVRLPVLVGVPSHDVYATAEALELLGIVGVEVEEQAALLLLVGIVLTALEHVGLTGGLEGEALPLEGRVLRDDHMPPT